MLESITNRKAFVTADQLCDYLPVCSTISNVTAIFFKYIYLPKITPHQIRNNHYYEHINKKDLFRCIMLLIPGFGNIFIAFKHRVMKLRGHHILHYFLDP